MFSICVHGEEEVIDDVIRIAVLVVPRQECTYVGHWMSTRTNIYEHTHIPNQGSGVMGYSTFIYSLLSVLAHGLATRG